jgi:Translation initiation factor 2, alpha subunit (eIF-2alpha)
LADLANDWPEEGELVVCSVKSVKENGAYLDLDTYPEREGFIFIGEIATGWVRNIKTHVREGQRVGPK